MRNDKGFTILEIVIVICILGIIAIPIFNTFISGYDRQNKATVQEDYQAKVQEIMYAIVDGPAGKNGGLRYASSAKTLENRNDNIAFVDGTQNTIYFLDNGTLYRKVSSSSFDAIPDPGTSEKLLDNVGDFEIDIAENENVVTIKIVIDTADTGVQDVALETKVKMRNAI
ncbi:type II secretion system protein [Candidatus Formimonas warabiya]|uniref:Prepilin-type N-terminal cleavage/methylation domain-containing protein n=1 Tax=Formimonas warabiya TaxID=1761012 RepID=A0A3G1KW85_FORW1|nr:prepilin-type N-terminal cleavage/methylation domain-containing protein [Candidatus Formimonas warabiya]ATW26734.1 hypothetical protein DCMF_19970 [Candidatus Formimonas warabiya]